MKDLSNTEGPDMAQEPQQEFQAESPLLEAWRMYRRNIPALFGTVMLTLIVAATLYGTFFYTGDAYEIVWAPHEPPGMTPEFPLGTDYLGRDLIAGLFAALGTVLLAGLAHGVLGL